MCLYIKDIQKQVATEPVKVYKLLDIRNVPPYYPTDAYHIGINKPETQEAYTVYEGEYWVGAGYLHAYTDKAKAIHTAKEISWLYQTVTESGTIQYKIVEMYIPKGTAYYENPYVQEVAAEALEWRPESQVELGEVDYNDEAHPFKIRRQATIYKETNQ